MRVVLDSVYEQVPVGPVGAYMDQDPHRIVAADTSLSTLIGIFLATPYRRLVVIERGRLMGIISRRDVIDAALPFLDEKSTVNLGGDMYASVPVPDRPPALNVATFMDRNARTITPGMGLLDVAHIFLTTNFRRLPVLDDNRIIGQVSRRDLLSASHESSLKPAATRHDPVYVSGINTELPPSLHNRLSGGPDYKPR